MTETIHQPLIIRADGSAQIGTGHVMRCLALAQAWQDTGGHVIFLMAMESPPLEARLRSEGMEVVHLPVQPGSTDDAIQTAALARQVGAGWVVVDGYHFDAGYQRAIKDQGLLLLFVDDIGHAEHYYADLVLNQNIHAHEGLYQSREPYTRLLLGTRYVLLRREFLKWRGWKREIPEVARRVLVTMGGSDPDNVTFKVIRALQQVDVDGLEAIVVVGGSNPHYEELQSAVQNSSFPIQLESNVTDMPELMAWADAAVSSGGSTSWELAFLGLPSVVIVLAQSQQPVAERLHEAKIALSLGWHVNLSCDDIGKAITRLLKEKEIRTGMARRGRELVDGDGVTRVLMHLRGERLRLRLVREEDCKKIWEWANDPDVRAVSFLSEPVPWEEHLKWFRSKLNNNDCLFLVCLESEDLPIGQVRFDIMREEKEAVISVSVDRNYRGKGYGSAMIRLASQMLFGLSGVNTIHAYIKQNNEPSIRAFMKAGYRKSGVTMIKGHQAVHLILERQGGSK